jgi:hypothetical protein
MDRRNELCWVLLLNERDGTNSLCVECHVKVLVTIQ